MTAMAHLKFLLLLLWVGVTVSTVVDLRKRIYGGHDCQNERHYHVKVISQKGQKQSYCGGSLIHPRTLSEIVGVHPGPGQDQEVAKKKPYKQGFFHTLKTAVFSFFEKNIWKTNIFNRKHDIMLLELSEPLTGIQPVALPDCNKPPKIGDVVQVAGLGGYRVNATGHTLPGQPPHLQCADMHVVDCEPTRNSPCYSDVPYDNRLCLEEPNVDIRGGDSGGGVIYNNVIYGVFSGSGVRACTVPAVTVNVCSYMKWINQTIYP
uniref:anionic trypsin-2 n=1 Tax=Maylandia zebra TaxID=106582 RepID=UPI000D31D83E|nr:anionic trypsin-2-like [Maylandia zebra]